MREEWKDWLDLVGPSARRPKSFRELMGRLRDGRARFPPLQIVDILLYINLMSCIFLLSVPAVLLFVFFAPFCNCSLWFSVLATRFWVLVPVWRLIFWEWFHCGEWHRKNFSSLVIVHTKILFLFSRWNKMKRHVLPPPPPPPTLICPHHSVVVVMIYTRANDATVGKRKCFIRFRRCDDQRLRQWNSICGI